MALPNSSLFFLAPIRDNKNNAMIQMNVTQMMISFYNKLATGLFRFFNLPRSTPAILTVPSYCSTLSRDAVGLSQKHSQIGLHTCSISRFLWPVLSILIRNLVPDYDTMVITAEARGIFTLKLCNDLCNSCNGMESVNG